MSPTLWTIASQAPLSMGFLRQGCWSGFPCPSPGDLPDPEINPASLKSPALACYVPLAPLGKSKNGASKSQSSENVTLLSSTQVPFVLSTSRGRVLVLCEFWLGGNSAMEYAVPGWVFGFSEGRDSTQEQQRGIPPEERVWGLLTSQQRAGQVFHLVERPRNSSGQGKQPTAGGEQAVWSRQRARLQGEWEPYAGDEIVQSQMPGEGVLPGSWGALTGLCSGQ